MTRTRATATTATKVLYTLLSFLDTLLSFLDTLVCFLDTLEFPEKKVTGDLLFDPHEGDGYDRDEGTHSF